MKKAIALSVTLLASLSLAACSNSGHSSAHSGGNKDTSSKVSKTSKKASTDQSKQSGSSSQQSSSSTASSSSSSSDTNSQLAAQLTDNDWYMLAYLQTWGAKTPQEMASYPMDNLEFYTNDNGRSELDQGHVDSTCYLVATTSTTVTIAPSTGEGVDSQFPNKTLSKADLLKSLVPDETYLASLKKNTAAAEQNGKEALAEASSLSNDANSSSSDDDQSDSNNDQSSVDSDQDNDSNQTDSNQDTDDDTDQ